MTKAFKDKITKVGDCDMWTAGCHMQGYPMMRNPDNMKQMVVVVRHLAEKKLGYKLDRNTRVKNNCGNIKCVNIDHYDIVHKDEDMDRWKCTPHQIAEEIRQDIRDDYNNTEKYHGQKRDLKKKYNITYETLTKILSGK
tara:strand:+ start:40 stop:456 length:417 start_codon:yes stop_codon:yes gene_type:complete